MPMDSSTQPQPPINRLRAAGLRPTRQRLALARLLFGAGDRPTLDRHVSAEALHSEAQRHRVHVSLATVYNTLNQFTQAGLLREVVVESGRSYFDTNVSDHHHFFHESDGELCDIPGASVVLGELPQAPHGTEIARVDVVIRVRNRQ
ncbi:MAG: iron response transcriptional regulator IrrA [Rhodospirillales bacterium]